MREIFSKKALNEGVFMNSAHDGIKKGKVAYTATSPQILMIKGLILI